MKWALKLLLAVVLFIILLPLIILVIILLAIPIRYSVSATTGEEDGTRALVKVSYLLRLFRMVYVYENGESKSTMRIAWFTLGKKKPKKKQKDKREEKEEVDKPEKPPALLKPSKKKDPKEQEKIEQQKKTGIFKTIKDNINMVLTYPNRKIIMNLVLGTLKKIAKILLPKKFNVSGIVGFEDPSKTGIFIGLYESVVSLLKIKRHIQISGIFDTPNTVIKLQVNAKGRVSIARMILPILGLVIKKPIRTLISDLLNIRKEDSDE